MANERFKELLAGANETWQDDSAGEVPNAVYLLQLQSAELIEGTDKEGAPVVKIKWEHLIREGEFAGRVLVDFSQPMSSHPFPRKLLKRRIAALGFEAPDDLTDLEEIVSAINNAAPVYRAKVQIKNDFPQIDVLEVVNGVGAPKPKTTVAAKPAAAAEAPAAEPALPIGTAVQFDADGTTHTGRVTGVNADGSLEVTDDADEGKYDANADELTPIEEAGEEDAARQGLLELGQAASVEVAEDMTLDEIVAALSAREWPEAELTADEIELLKSVGIATKPKPKPVVRKPAAKAPVKKTVAKKPIRKK